MDIEAALATQIIEAYSSSINTWPPLFSVLLYRFQRLVAVTLIAIVEEQAKDNSFDHGANGTSDGQDKTTVKYLYCKYIFRADTPEGLMTPLQVTIIVCACTLVEGIIYYTRLRTFDMNYVYLTI